MKTCCKIYLLLWVKIWKTLCYTTALYRKEKHIQVLFIHCYLRMKVSFDCDWHKKKLEDTSEYQMYYVLYFTVCLRGGDNAGHKVNSSSSFLNLTTVECPCIFYSQRSFCYFFVSLFGFTKVGWNVSHIFASLFFVLSSLHCSLIQSLCVHDAT